MHACVVPGPLPEVSFPSVAGTRRIEAVRSRQDVAGCNERAAATVGGRVAFDLSIQRDDPRIFVLDGILREKSVQDCKILLACLLKFSGKTHLKEEAANAYAIAVWVLAPWVARGNQARSVQPPRLSVSPSRSHDRQNLTSPPC